MHAASGGVQPPQYDTQRQVIKTGLKLQWRPPFNSSPAHGLPPWLVSPVGSGRSGMESTWFDAQI
jgi:hypothetical protein